MSRHVCVTMELCSGGGGGHPARSSDLVTMPEANEVPAVCDRTKEIFREEKAVNMNEVRSHQA